MRKRLFRLTAAALLLLLLCACGSMGARSPYNEVNTLDGVWLEVESAMPTGARISFYNAAGREDLIRGLSYCIEQTDGRHWYALDSKLDISGGPSLDIRIPRATGSVCNPETTPVDTAEYDWEWSYGQLEPGDYRFIIEVLSDESAPSASGLPKYYLSAEFTVSA